MAQKHLSGRGFADALIFYRTVRNGILDKLDSELNWTSFSKILSSIYSSSHGRKSYPLLTLFKALLLQQWYDLSDTELEEALMDRISFRKFCDFSLSDRIPDHTTLCRFRNELAKRNMAEALFDEFNKQLEDLGLILKQGTLVDATVIESAASRPSGGQVSNVDPEAGWTKKNSEYHHGYKAHIGVDEGSEIIRKAKITSADIHDSLAACEVICGDEKKAYADKAYDSKELRELLNKRGIVDNIMYKAAKGRPLKGWQKWFNKAVSKVRCAVERSFGTMKRGYGYVRAKYYGRTKNQNHLHLLALALNMRKFTKLKA